MDQGSAFSGAPHQAKLKSIISKFLGTILKNLQAKPTMFVYQTAIVLNHYHFLNFGI